MYGSAAADVLARASDLRSDPWRTYAWLRRHRPTIYSSTQHAHLVFRDRDVRAALVSRQVSVFHPFRASRRLFGPTILDTDGLDHGRLRRPLMESLNAINIPEYEAGVVRPLASLLVNRLTVGGGGDVVTDVAEVLPMMVLARLLGLPDDDVSWLSRTVAVLGDYIDRGGADRGRAREAHRRLCEYIEDKIASAAFNGLAGRRLRQAADDGELSSRELVAHVALLLLGGTATTTGAIANAVGCIARRPGAFARIASGEIDVLAAVREALRLEPPLRFTTRFVTASGLRLGGELLEPGSALHLCLASANRDPESFVMPDRWVPERTGPMPLTFGRGPHACVGKLLGELEAAAVVREIAALGEVTVTTGSALRPGWAFRRRASALLRVGAVV